MVLLEMTALHCSCPPDLSAAAAPDAPDEQKQLISGLFIHERDYIYPPNVQ